MFEAPCKQLLNLPSRFGRQVPQVLQPEKARARAARANVVRFMNLSPLQNRTKCGRKIFRRATLRHYSERANRLTNIFNNPQTFSNAPKKTRC
jgi:hypothetical protein